jgi:hypothetical protein
MKHLTIVACTFLTACSGAKEQEPRTIPRNVELSPGVVIASGRWVTTAKLDTPLLARINSAEISCRQETMTCTDAVAVLVTSSDEPRLNGELLLSVMDSYKIDSWTDTHIHATAEKPVADLTLEIDLVHRALKRTFQETRARGNATADPRFLVTWDLQ